jgi:hypothetical protein
MKSLNIIIGLIILILIASVLIIGNKSVLAQSRDMVDEMIERTVKESSGFYNLYAAFAIREDDLSACNNAASYSKCINRAENIYDIQNFAEGNCDKFETGMKRDLCLGIDKGCSVVDTTAREMCTAVNRRDVRKISEISYKPDWAFNLQPMTEDEARAMIGIYEGYKNNNLASCNAFAKGPHSIMIAGVCQVLFSRAFSSSDFEKLTDKLVDHYKRKVKSSYQVP